MMGIWSKEYRGFEIRIELRGDTTGQHPYRATIRRPGQAHAEAAEFEAATQAEVISLANAAIDSILVQERGPGIR
jgi:hypothetical protein